MTQSAETQAKGTQKRLHGAFLIFLVGMLFTFLLWDHYFNSMYPLDRTVVSSLILLMGTLFSTAAGLFVWSLERTRSILEAEVRKHKKTLFDRNHKLESALHEIKSLRGYIPICAYCKKIRNDLGYWEELEQYIQSHSEAQFSHAMCGKCIQDLYPEHVKKRPAL